MSKRSTKRRPRVLPPGYTAEDWFALQDYWDQLAADGPDGITDIESGRDLNRFPASTLPGAHGLSFVPLVSEDDAGESFDSVQLHEQQNVSIYGQATGVADTPQAVLWDDAAYFAHRLPPDDEHRDLIVRWTETGKLTETAKEFGLSRFAAYRAITKFCRLAGLDYDQLMASADIYRGAVGPDTFADPCVKVAGRCTCPVRRLSATETKNLTYKPPSRDEGAA
jgi:hypothetical protein